MPKSPRTPDGKHLPWHKRYQRDALDGMRSMTFEQRGAYNALLDLIYDRQPHPLPDDDDWIAERMGCQPRLWKRLKLELVAAGKITISDGAITNDRALREIAELACKPENSRTHSRTKVGKKSNKIRVSETPKSNFDPPVSSKNNGIAGPRARASQKLRSLEEVEGSIAEPSTSDLSVGSPAASPPPAPALARNGFAEAGGSAPNPEAERADRTELPYSEMFRDMIGLTPRLLRVIHIRDREPTDDEYHRVWRWLEFGVPPRAIKVVLHKEYTTARALRGPDADLSHLALYDEAIRRAWLWRFQNGLGVDGFAT